MRFLALFSGLAASAILVACSGSGSSITPSSDRGTAGTQSRVRAASFGTYGFTGMTAYFEHSLICDEGVLLANYAKTYGIGTIMVPVMGDDISSLLGDDPTTVNDLTAMTSAAKVYLMTGDVSWLATPTTVPPDAASLAQIAAKFPQVAGVYYAIDPATSSGWNSSQRATLIQEEQTLQQTLLGMPGAASFKQTYFLGDVAFATVHATKNPNSPTLLAALQKPSGVTGMVVPAAGGSSSVQLNNLAGAVPQMTKPFIVQANANIEKKTSGYYGVTSSYLQQNLSTVAQTVASENAHFTNVQLNAWSDLYNSAQSILPQPPVFNGVLASGPLVPATGMYLGGYIDSTPPQSPTQTAAFEQTIGRTLAYNMHFYGFTQRFPGSAEADDLAHHRIPVIAWNCGDNDANLARGGDDANLTSHALAIKAYGGPVFLRWFWEMNLDDTNNAPRTQCYDPSTDLPNGYFSPLQYIAAWKHVRYIFAKNGVTNVAWLWCVAAAHGGPGQYYPGDSEVDWVAMDNYDETNVPMATKFYDLSNELSQFQEKPFMITETGAFPDYQEQFIKGGVEVLKKQFPWARGIGYLDAQGSHANYILSGSGLAAFTTFANEPYMSAMGPTPSPTP